MIFQNLELHGGPSEGPQSLCKEEWGIDPFLKVAPHNVREEIDDLSEKKMWVELAKNHGVFKVPYNPSLGKRFVDCEIYVFEAVYKTPWRHLMRNMGASVDMDKNPIDYLGSIGYRVTYQPMRWDIIAYVGRNSKQKIVLTHYGILEANDEVVSKWGQNELMRHEIFNVPHIYGNEIIFFRHKDRD
jgi:hypothetical protein